MTEKFFFGFGPLQRCARLDPAIQCMIKMACKWGEKQVRATAGNQWPNFSIIS